MAKKLKPPVLTTKDYIAIRAIFLKECLSVNREVRKELAALRKEIKQLKQSEQNDRSFVRTWLEVALYVRANKEFKIGDSISEAALRFVKERDDFKRMSNGWQENYNQIKEMYAELETDNARLLEELKKKEI